MTKSELILKLVERYQNVYPRSGESLNQKVAEQIVTTIFDQITMSLSDGDRVELRGFGAFSIKERSSRIGRNPRTGEKVEVDSKFVPFFKTGKQLRERVNSGK